MKNATVVEATRDLTAYEVYCATVDGATSLKDIADSQKFTFTGFARIEGEDARGNDCKLTVIFTDEGDVLATQSETASNAIHSMWSTFGDSFCFRKASGTTKSGRTFVTLKPCK